MIVLKKLRNNDGYTFIEIFMVLLIISLVSTIIYTNINKITDSINKSKVKLDSKYNLLKLQLIVSEELQKVKTPHLLNEHLIILESDCIILYYYEGDKESYIKLESMEEQINIYIGELLLSSFYNLKGMLILKKNYVIYKEDDFEMIFPLGTFIV